MLYLMMWDYLEALRVVGAFAREVKKLDDKLLFVDIYLFELRIYYVLCNLLKSKVVLMVVRMNVNVIYVSSSV